MWSDLGNAYRVKGESARAVEVKQSARCAAQPHPDFYLNPGGVRFVMGEPEEAIRSPRSACRCPRHTLLQYSIGNLRQPGRTEAAVRSFELRSGSSRTFPRRRAGAPDKLKKEMRGRWLPSGGVADACAALLALCVFVQRSVSAFVLGSVAGRRGVREPRAARAGPWAAR